MRERLSVLMLGAVGVDIRPPPSLPFVVAVYGIDAVQPTMKGDATTSARIVAPNGGPVILSERRFAACSSVPAPLPGPLQDFGLEPFYELTGKIEGNAVILAQLQQDLGPFDVIKLDLEGLEPVSKFALGGFPRRWDCDSRYGCGHANTGAGWPRSPRRRSATRLI